MGDPVVHFEVISKNGQTLQDFYSELFDWKISSDNPMNYGIVDTGAGRGINGGVGPGENQLVTFYVAVKDIDAALERAQSLGAKIVTPKTEIPNMVTMAQIADPDGNVVGLVVDVEQ